ncbi:MAG: hypothetical protein ABIT37_25300 [Luteolibacter sp.]
MLPTSRAWLNVLRLGLLASACGWGISFFFTFSTWEIATNQLYDMGANTIPYDPLLNYWLKMASAAFGCIGIASALACARPHGYAGLIRLLGPFHLFIAVTLAFAAYQNHLTPNLHPTFIPDITFCVIAGTLIQLPLVREWWVARKIS